MRSARARAAARSSTTARNFSTHERGREYDVVGGQRSAVDIVEFASAKEAERWLAENHADSDGVWVRLFKKHSGVPTATYDEVLDAALCYGWIDGQLKSHDDESWLRKFTPRRAKSIWAKRNTEHAERLIRAGRMKPAGLREIEAAKKDGRWKSAYDSPSKMTVPDDFLRAVAKNKRTRAFFDGLDRANTYAIAWRLRTAKKPETRKKRFDTLLAMLTRGEKIHG
jgi:uncharacterized protein YdeI (YjbR/CyaY-like superfamily)